MAEAEVENDIQAVLFHNRFCSMRLFTGLGETRPEVRESLKEIGLDSSASLQVRQQVATVLSAWTSAKEYIASEQSSRAESRANRIPRPVGPTEYQAMRSAVEAQWGKLKGCETPSKSYLGMKAENIEDNEIIAEELSEVTSKNDTEVDMLMATLDEQGRFVVKKGAKQGRNPTGTEEFRTKLAIMGNVWLFLKTKHSNRPWLADFNKDVFKDMADHILGETSWGLRSHNSGIEVGPSWNMVLKYEHELRKKAAERVGEGTTYKEAIKAVCEDSTLTFRHKGEVK